MASRNTPGTAESGMTKAQRREQARRQALEIQAAEARKAKRNRLIIILTSIVAILAVALAVIFIVQQGKKAATATAPEGYTGNGGIVVGKGENSIPTAGVTNKDVPKVTVYADYLCSHCNTLESEYGNKLMNLAAQGKIALEVHPVAILGYEFSSIAAQADYYVSVKAPSYYAAYRSAVFNDVTKPVFKGSGTPPANDSLLKVAQKVGLPKDVQDGLSDVIKNKTYKAWIDAQNTNFGKAGLTGTPTVLVNGKKIEDWSKVIDEAQKAAGATWELSDAAPTTPASASGQSPQATPEVTSEATQG